MCDFCEKQEVIETKIWWDDFDLHLWIDCESPDILNIRIGKEMVGNTKPFRINFCPYCGKDLKYLKHLLDETY